MIGRQRVREYLFMTVCGGRCGHVSICCCYFFPLHIVCAFCKSLENALFKKKKALPSYLVVNGCLLENIINVYVITWQMWYLQMCVCPEYKQIETSDFDGGIILIELRINLKG